MGSAVPNWFGRGAKNLACCADILARVNGVLDTMVWSTVDIPVEFQISKDLLGQGGFRKAYRAKSNTQEFLNAEWVVKRYKTSALIKEIEAMNQSVEQHTRKVVQMHHLARNFAAQLTQVVLDQDLRDLFGTIW